MAIGLIGNMPLHKTEEMSHCEASYDAHNANITRTLVSAIASARNRKDVDVFFTASGNL